MGPDWVGNIRGCGYNLCFAVETVFPPNTAVPKMLDMVIFQKGECLSKTLNNMNNFLMHPKRRWVYSCNS